MFFFLNKTSFFLKSKYAIIIGLNDALFYVDTFAVSHSQKLVYIRIASIRERIKSTANCDQSDSSYK